MKNIVSETLEISHFTRPDHRAEAAAMEIMRSAFNPAFGEAWTASQLAGFMSMPGATLTVARLDNANLGFALSRAIIDEAELLLIATHRHWQRHGIGELLLKDFIARSRKSHIGTLHLEVRDNNPAINFYINHGFEQIHRRPSYYKGRDGTFYDALSFQLILN